jgi:hypothetical protein
VGAIAEPNRPRRALTRIAVSFALLACSASCIEPDAPADTAAPDASNAPPPPVGISAVPGPTDRGITVSWSFIDRAQSYVLYWGTRPDLTKANAFRAAGVAPPFLHQDRVAGTTYYYMVSSTDGTVEGDTGPIIAAKPKDTIGIRIESPVPGTRPDATLSVVAGISSAAPLASLVATADNTTVPLVFDSNIGLYTGTVAFAAPGSPTAVSLIVRATDTQSRSAEGTVIVRYDRPPVVSVQLPPDGSTVPQNVRLAATCADDAPGGCVSLVAYVELVSAPALATGTSGIDQAVSLATYTGRDIRIVFEGTDTAGQKTRIFRAAHVQ